MSTPDAGSDIALHAGAGTNTTDRSSDPLGLSIVYTPEENRTADIIFIHGLGGSSRMTWCKSRRLDTFWPREWLPKDEDLHHARIFTFGYNSQFRSSSQSSALGISDFSKNLLYDMIFARDLQGGHLHMGEVPIIFVVHSMGGLVFKKAYLDARLDARYATVMNSTKAVVFLSTPHRGSDLAPYLNRVLSASFGSTPKQYVAELTKSSSFLHTVNEQFRHVANELQIFSFFETLRSSIGVASALILDPESAKLGYPGEVSRSLNANHYHVCKFETPQDTNYRVVVGALKSIVSSIHSTGTELDAQHGERLRSFLSISAAIDHDFDLFCGRRAEGTCQWLLEQAPIREWLSTPSQSEVLMIHGRPGRGKSVVASFLAQHLNGFGAVVQYFFFRAGDETKTTMAALIRTIAFQIAQQLPSFRKTLLDMVDGGYKPKDAEWRSTWKRLFVNLLFEMEFHPPLYWIIDGVDEAASPHHLFELLSDLKLSKIPIRVLVTSRWSQTLVSALERASSRVPSSMFSIDSDLTDMRLYVEEELKYNNWEEKITDKVVRQVLERANDNFLWVHLILEELKDCNTEEDIEDRLFELPRGMDGLYQRMEETICRIQRPSDRNLARRLLIWSMYTRRTLAMDELSDALAPDFGRILDISQTAGRLCGHFITIEGEDKIGLIHQTAREYLTTTSSLPFSLDGPAAHGELFRASITSFLDKGLRSKLQRASPKLLEYRATSWPYHLCATDLQKNGGEHLDLLTQFFTQPSVLIWTHVLALLGQLRVLIEASQSLYTFVRRKRKAEAVSDPAFRRFDELEVLESWSRDLLKLLGKFGSCLTQEPTIIYTSVASFCPTSSSIFKTFGRQQTSNVAVQGLPEDWDDCLARVSVSAESVATLICCSGRYLAVGTSGKTAVVWDCTTFHQVAELEHGEAVSALCFSSKGDRLAIYGLRHTKIWTPQTGKLLLSIPNYANMQALCLQFVDDDTAITMGSDHRCVLRASLSPKAACEWSNMNPQLLNDTESLEGTYLNSPVALSITPDGSKIAATYRRFPLTIWSFDSATPLVRLARPDKAGQPSKPLPFVSKISWHPGGDEILGIFMDGHSFRWNIVDGAYQEHAPTPGQMPSDIICSPDGLVYAICGVRGTIRLFDYQSSMLIYQLNSDDLITAFCFSHDGRKFYDIRGSYCTVWEPNALMRLTMVDDDAAHSQAAEQSVRQSQVASETAVDSSAPVLLMSPAPQNHAVCFGNEEGAVELFDYEASEKLRLGQTASQMSIEHLAWSEDGYRVCYAELGGRLTVVQLDHGKEGRRARRVERFKPKFDTVGVAQILFLPGSRNSLLVSSSSSVQRWSLEPAQLETTWDYGQSPTSRQWIPHPRYSRNLLSITPDGVSVHLRCSLEKISTVLWDAISTGDRPDDALPESSSTYQNPNDAVDDVTVNEEVESVKNTFVDGHLLVKISRTSSSSKLRPRFLIFDANHNLENSISLVHIPEKVSQMVEMPLNVLPNGKLVFIDQSFRVCSWHIGPTSRADNVQRYFFIPRDWLPLQSLGLLQITSTGAILCPRKGGVSVIHSSIGAAF
ncbi:hypothetical protein H634G_09522 [Metarhizium anisopliae BRIP 53293]|uniref:NACHT domain-containing protein n=1 Tax=Metarhizium anisopliae BRIP 53293 TaxID=1291518 RepID=A0A0D9NMQ1_METAN|nr:hypothetical protein H634G_09522 [Metarhizium anisopliae BRIP 53293]KJK89572.1 hypothetical protein H633G_06564 [Metarhizium anisopliae BRIP 53284]